MTFHVDSSLAGPDTSVAGVVTPLPRYTPLELYAWALAPWILSMNDELGAVTELPFASAVVGSTPEVSVKISPNESRTIPRLVREHYGCDRCDPVDAQNIGAAMKVA